MQSLFTMATYYDEAFSQLRHTAPTRLENSERTLVIPRQQQGNGFFCKSAFIAARKSRHA